MWLTLDDVLRAWQLCLHSDHMLRELLSRTLLEVFEVARMCPKWDVGESEQVGKNSMGVSYPSGLLGENTLGPMYLSIDHSVHCIARTTVKLRMGLSHWTLIGPVYQLLALVRGCTVARHPIWQYTRIASVTTHALMMYCKLLTAVVQ